MFFVNACQCSCKVLGLKDSRVLGFQGFRAGRVLAFSVFLTSGLCRVIGF